MKRIICILLTSIIFFVTNACDRETCTDNYIGTLKIDGKKGDNVFIKYVGPKQRKYEIEFMFSPLENKLPYHNYFLPHTICSTKDFKNHNHNFLHIKNTSEEDIIICGVFSGAEIDEHPEETYYRNLLDIYNKQDKDPNYDYTKDKHFTGIKYMERSQFYKKLLQENYPYIIKLAPQKECIMKWGNLGFQVL